MYNLETFQLKFFLTTFVFSRYNLAFKRERSKIKRSWWLHSYETADISLRSDPVTQRQLKATILEQKLGHTVEKDFHSL